jgi:hypothetical protein
MLEFEGVLRETQANVYTLTEWVKRAMVQQLDGIAIFRRCLLKTDERISEIEADVSRMQKFIGVLATRGVLSEVSNSELQERIRSELHG